MQKFIFLKASSTCCCFQFSTQLHYKKLKIKFPFTNIAFLSVKVERQTPQVFVPNFYFLNKQFSNPGGGDKNSSKFADFSKINCRQHRRRLTRSLKRLFSNFSCFLFALDEYFPSKFICMALEPLCATRISHLRLRF